MKRAVWLGLWLLPAVALTDEVHLRGGGKITGTVVERSDTSVVLEVGPGWVTVPMARVARIDQAHSALAEFRARARALSPNDLQGWLDLALWAQERELLTQAREAFERVLLIDPGHSLAHQALSHVPLDDRWVTEEEAYRARGYVRFEGTWVTPPELEAALRERAEVAAAERARQEGEARVREAEARAREAEARAAVAEAEARAAQEGATDLGVPWYPPYGAYGVVVGPGHVCSPACAHRGIRHSTRTVSTPRARAPRRAPDPTPPRSREDKRREGALPQVP
jgi:hypothetical protein